MGSGDSLSDDRPTSPRDFAALLADLKQEGVGVLLVGDVPQSVGLTVRRRLFGDEAAQRRHRICVSTGAECSPPLPSGHMQIDSAQWTFITYAAEMRSAAQTVPTIPDHMGKQAITQECTTLSELGIAISDSIAEMEAHCDGFAPAQLRVGFDSFAPIVEKSESAGFRFLHLLIERVKTVDGMIHCPLHYALDSEIVRLYEPLFDAIIELRVKNNEAQQRWHFTSHGIQSVWLPTP